MKAPRRELAVVLASWSLNCGGTHAGPDTPNASDTSRSSGEHPVFSNCLLGNANIKATRHWETSSKAPPSAVTQGGSCTIGASCIERQGRDTPGDGQVSLTCSSGQCACRFQPLTPPAPAWQFEFPATCTAYDQARQLMLDNCLKEMHLAPTPSSVNSNDG